MSKRDLYQLFTSKSGQGTLEMVVASNLNVGRHLQMQHCFIRCAYCYLYIIQFVRLFVRNSRLNYAKNSHQSLRNYRDPPGRTTPRIGVTRPVVSMAFPVYFRYSLRGRPPYFNYRFVGFPVSTRVLLHQQRSKN